MDQALLQFIGILVVLMVIVSLSGTYDITYKLLSTLGFNVDRATYGTGMELTQPGFMLHVFVFAALVFVLKKYNKL
jgi:hypothetical protein